MEKNCVLLKILSGNHVGAEVELNEGKWKIGSSQDCDFLLSDIHIKALHLELHIEKENVFLIPKEGILFLNNTQVKEEKCLLPPYAVVSLGSLLGTYFAIGPCNGTWEEIQLPITQEQKITESIQHTEKTEEIQLNIAIPQEEEREEKNISTFDKNISKTKEQTTKKKKSGLSFYLLIILLLFLACGGSFVAYQYTKSANSIIQDPLIDLLQTNIYSDVVYINDTDNKSIKGSVATEEDIARLEVLVQNIENPPVLELYSAEKLEQELQVLLQSQDAFLEVSRTAFAPKEIRIRGYVYNQEVFQELIKPLEKTLELFPVKLNLTFVKDIDAKFNSLLQRDNLNQKVSIFYAPFNIGIQSTGLTLEEERQLQSILLELEEIIQGKSPFVHIKNKSIQQPTTQNIPSEQNFLLPSSPCDNLKVHMENNKLTLMLEGKQYMQGSKLPNGWLVKDISVNMIVLTDNNNHMQICENTL